MLDMEKFLSGEIVYYVSHTCRLKFLEMIENETDVHWVSGAKPTEFIPPTGKLEDEFNTCISISKNWHNENCLVYGDLEFLKNRNVEVFEYD